ncbi:MAG: hypothetical protein H0W60_08240, partial [Chloroflexi bacterium]|nr:hypothetical protein [Chloroflexota bacterium]
MMATLYRAGIRPRLRYQETMLLALMGVALSAGWVSLASQQAGRMTIGDPAIPVIYVGILFAIHLAFVLTGRRMDQVLLPVTGMLGSLSLLLMARLPQGLAGLSLGGLDLGLAPLQLLWLSLALAVLAILAVTVRNDNWLREYKYTWAAVGIGLLLLVFVLPPTGAERIDAPRLSLRIGPITGQPSELLKVILVVFLA